MIAAAFLPPVTTFGPDIFCPAFGECWSTTPPPWWTESQRFREGWAAFAEYERALSAIHVPPYHIHKMARTVAGCRQRRAFRAHAAAYYAAYRAAMRRRVERDRRRFAEDITSS